MEWKDVTNGLPHCYEEGEWDGKRSDNVLVVDSKNKLHVCVLYSGHLDGSEFNCFYDTHDYEVENVVKWMELPLY